MSTISAAILVLALCSVQSQQTRAQDTLTIGMDNQFGTIVNERDGQMVVCASVMGTQPQSLQQISPSCITIAVQWVSVCL